MKKYYPIFLVSVLALLLVFAACDLATNGGNLSGTTYAVGMQTQELGGVNVAPLPGCGVGADSACQSCGRKNIPITCYMQGCEWCANPCNCGAAHVGGGMPIGLLSGCGIAADSACQNCSRKTAPVTCRMYGCEWCANPCNCGAAHVGGGMPIGLLSGCGIAADSACQNCSRKTAPVTCRMYGCEWCANPCNCGSALVGRVTIGPLPGNQPLVCGVGSDSPCQICGRKNIPVSCSMYGCGWCANPCNCGTVAVGLPWVQS